MNDDRLAFLLRAPAVVETVIRATLRAALEARRAYERPIDARDFANEALAHLNRTMLADGVRLDAVGHHELAAATMRAAMRFVSSRLAQRLFSIDSRRLCVAPSGADAAIRSADDTLHFVRLESFASDVQRVVCARQLVQFTEGSTLRRPAVHFFSLRTSRLRSFATAHASPADDRGTNAA